MRLNADGSIDTAFDAALGSGSDGVVNTLAVQANGKILVGGQFTSLHGQSTPSNLMRLNSDGSVDASFNLHLGTGLNEAVTRIQMQSDGKILIGGDFDAATNPAGSAFLRKRAGGNGHQKKSTCRECEMTHQGTAHK